MKMNMIISKKHIVLSALVLALTMFLFKQLGSWPSAWRFT